MSTSTLLMFIVFSQNYTTYYIDINFLYYIEFRVLLHTEVNKGFNHCTISEYYLSCIQNSIINLDVCRKKRRYIYITQSSLGIHRVHQRLLLRWFSSLILSFSVFKIFLWKRSAEAKAFLCDFSFFLGFISCQKIRRRGCLIK